jgi:hypothetical protein
MVQPEMSENLLPTLIDSQGIVCRPATMIIEISRSRFLHVICATHQLETQKQKHYQINEFLPVHVYYSLRTNLIIGFLRVKVEQLGTGALDVTLWERKGGSPVFRYPDMKYRIIPPRVETLLTVSPVAPVPGSMPAVTGPSPPPVPRHPYTVTKITRAVSVIAVWVWIVGWRRS